MRPAPSPGDPPRAAASYCPHCGRPRAAGARFCRGCGSALRTLPAAGAGPVRARVPTWPARRPVWLVVVLTLATYGLYAPIWFGVTWAELRRTRPDLRLAPALHGLALLVPGWNLVRLHRHYVVIAERAKAVDDRPNMGPKTALALGGLAAILFLFPPGAAGLTWASLWLRLSALAGGAAVLAQGQADLNTFWFRSARGQAPVRVGRLEGVAAGFLGALFLATWGFILLATGWTAAGI